MCDKDTEPQSPPVVLPKAAGGQQVTDQGLWSPNLNQIPEPLQTQLESSYLQSFPIYRVFLQTTGLLWVQFRSCGEPGSGQ